MDAELKALEEKISQFAEFCQRLRESNLALRQQLATALNQNQALEEKISSAADRLEQLLDQLPEENA